MDVVEFYTHFTEVLFDSLKDDKEEEEKKEDVKEPEVGDIELNKNQSSLVEEEADVKMEVDVPASKLNNLT